MSPARSTGPGAGSPTSGAATAESLGRIAKDRRGQDQARRGEHDHARAHGPRCLVRSRGLGRARDGEEGDAEGLDEARRGEPRGERQHAEGEHHQHGHQRRGRADAGEERLEEQPLRHEAVEGRQPAMATDAQEEEGGRPRHAADEATEAIHVARARRVKDGARAHEEQSLEGRVIHGMEERRGEGEGGRGKHLEALEEKAAPTPSAITPTFSTLEYARRRLRSSSVSA